jgi:cobaltochelatase CobT
VPQTEDLHLLFYRAVEAAMRAIADEPELTADFGEEGPRLAGGTAHLPLLPRVPGPLDVGEIRGASDAIALRLRFHDPETHARRRPRGRTARALYEAVEQARVEAIGAGRMAGVAANLSDALEKRCRAKGYDEVADRTDVPIEEAIGIYMRYALSGKPLPPAAQNLVELWRPWLEPRTSDSMTQLRANLEDQARFDEVLRDFIDSLGFDDEDADDDEDMEPDQQQADDSDGEGDSSEGDADADSESGDTDEQRSSAESDASDDESLDDKGMTGDTEDSEQPGRSYMLDDGRNEPDQPLYKAYVTAFDETIDANELCEEAELQRLRAILDERLSGLNSVIGRLANRLQRRLLAQQMRSWEFDRDEGLLDSARLSRVVTNPLMPLTYKLEKETEFRDTVVTLLLDNSGSMRGRPIMLAAMSADILARTLERCGVKTEILGFTTRAWKGGQSRERWLAEERPSNPGRLNDLRHIIYKTADMPYRRARTKLGLMLREGLLKENIDGEAVLWAYQRLLARTEQRRVLMVISDGAPVDDSTLSANPRNYLEQHLHAVVGWIEQFSDIDLIAIGIGHDVARYYERAVTITDAEQLGGAMLEKLAELFEEKPARPLARPKRPARRGRVRPAR